MKHAASLLQLALSATLAATLHAQTHRVEHPETVTRAVAVYEYLGDLQKPTAARLIPVSLFLGGHFEDAGTYLARPMPLALDTGTLYELQTAGNRIGTLDLAYAKNFRQNTAEATGTFDDGWFGYGTFRAPKIPKTPALTAKNTGKGTGHAYEVQDDGKPHFGSKPDATTAKNGRPADPDPADTDRATRISLPEDRNDRDPKSPDPDRPTLKRSSTDQTGGPKQKRQKETASVSQTPPDPGSDPDRPTIKRKDAATEDNGGIPPDPSELGSRKSAKGTGGTVTGAEPTLNDANRPELKRGKPAVVAANAPDLPKVTRVASIDLKQTVAISDSKDRPEHDFTHHFDNEAERTTALHGMESLAIAVLQNPSLATDAGDFTRQSAATTASSNPNQSPDAHTATPRTTTTHAAANTAARRAAAARNRATAASSTSASTTLADEQLSALQLSFGAPITYVFTAHTPDSTTPTRYVTVVAQQDPDNKLQPAFRAITDSAHLDRTPRFRFVDAVDADASNRASLLFELRSQSSRQFALYRLLGAHPDQIFETGSTR